MGKLVLVYGTDVGHKLEVVYQVLVLASGVLFELLEFVLENTKVDLEFRLILIFLSFYLVLQLCKRVGLFILV